MKRDKILSEKDRVQQNLWEEAGKKPSAYVSLIHKKAQKIITSHPLKKAVL